MQLIWLSSLRRYKLKWINDNIFKSETSKCAFGFLIQNIQANYETLNELDVMYENLVKTM